MLMKEILKKLFPIILLGIITLGMVNAVYPGECESVKFPNQDEVNFTLISNTSSFEGFNWSKKGYIITYCFPTYLASGNYSFEWGNYQDSPPAPIIVHHYSSSGSKTTKVYIENKTYVDNYVDKIIYQENDTKIQKYEDNLRKEKSLNDISRMVIGVLLLTLLAVAGNFLKNKKKK